MPWVGNADFTRWQDEKTTHRIRIAELEAQLAAETDRRERAELDLARLSADFKSLVALTAGRIPPKAAPEFDKDPFAEIESQAVTFLSPDPDELGVNGEEVLRTLAEASLKDDPLSG